jgi:hypothetical protein
MKTRARVFPWLKTGVISVCILSIFSVFTHFDVKFRYELQQYITCLPFVAYVTVPQTFTLDDLDIGDMVFLPSHIAPELLPPAIDIMKLVAAKGGDRIARVGNDYFINDAYAASFMPDKPIFLDDGEVRVLSQDEVWLLASSAHAIDSRYFGPVSIDTLQGRGYALF